MASLAREIDATSRSRRFSARFLALLVFLLVLPGQAETYKGEDWSIELPAGWGDGGFGVTNRSGCEFNVLYINEKMSSPKAVKAANPTKTTYYLDEGSITVRGRRGFYLDYQDGQDKFRYIVLPSKKDSRHSYAVVCKFRIDNFKTMLPEVMKVVQTINFSN